MTAINTQMLSIWFIFFAAYCSLINHAMDFNDHEVSRLLLSVDEYGPFEIPLEKYLPDGSMVRLWPPDELQSVGTYHFKNWYLKISYMMCVDGYCDVVISYTQIINPLYHDPTKPLYPEWYLGVSPNMALSWKVYTVKFCRTNPCPSEGATTSTTTTTTTTSTTILSADPLQCTDWPTSSGSALQKCENGNKLNDGFYYAYNEGRATASAVCGQNANCWCCTRRKPLSTLRCTGWPTSSGSSRQRCEAGNAKVDGYVYLFNALRYTNDAVCDSSGCWCCRASL